MERNISLLKCLSHDMSLLPIYCEDCECSVCTKCITGSHMRHSLLDVSTYVVRQKEELIASINEDCSKIERVRSELSQMKINTEERKNQVIEEISRREDAMIGEVKDISADYRSIVGEAALQHTQKIEQSESALHDISKISELNPETEADCIALLHCRSELRRVEREIKDQGAVHMSFEAMEGPSKTKLKELFGTVSVEVNEVNQSSDEDRTIEKKLPVQSRNAEDILKVKEKKLNKNGHPICIQFKISAPGIPDYVNDCTGVFFSDDKVYLYLDRKLFVKEKQREIYEVVKDVQHCTDYGIKHSSGNGLLVITKDESELGLLLQNRKIISIFKASGGNEKIVDMVESAKTGITVLSVKTSFWRGCFDSTVSLWQVNITGESKQLSSITLDKRVYVSKICILNATTQIVFNLDGCLSAYSHQLTFKFQYSGTRGTNPSSVFSASSVCVDSDDNILVSDSSDNTIHMLSIDGNFLKIIIWPEDNVKVKWLSLDKDGWLWIGQGGCQRPSDFCVFDYEYLKKTERTERALTESEEKVDTQE
ncbi:uncharacterized protein LOC134230076 [Saccostrea cucullata]|uniref:uncharacterized protein LOC134230076 n=1 Tax=Saccostrea cuccullata TaxID=36930 RepID=UPI002ED57910